MGDLVVFVLVLVIVAVVGVVVGRRFAAPALQRLADRADSDEQPTDGPA